MLLHTGPVTTRGLLLMAIKLDGTLNDWTSADRLDSAATGIAGYQLYGRIEGGVLYFGLQTDGTSIGPNTTFWLNTDLSAATGYQIWGAYGGAEYNVNFGSDGKPYLYTGAAGQTLVSPTPLNYVF